MWSERSLNVMEAGQIIDLSAIPIAGLCYDGEQVIAALSDGRALTMPSCAECNLLTEISDVPLGAAAYREGTLLFAGENFSFTLENALGLRQDGIRATAAREMQTGGAQIIDVRGKADFDQKHIAGSISIPVEEIAAKLPALCPDRSQRLIFYCVSGVRSQKALETARALGYASVYNLGGIEDWSFAFELAGS